MASGPDASRAERASRGDQGALPASTLAMARALVPSVLEALRARDAEPLSSPLTAGPSSFGSALRHLVTTQGVAPLIAEVVASTVVASGPAPTDADGTTGWLARQLQQNRVRSGLFATDLSAILAAAAACGLPVMPLKGSLLAFTRYRDPGLRPMADIDLLVRPSDERGAHEILHRLGYDLVRGDHRHAVYRRPGDKVVALDGTHPGNPRPVEIHTRLRRSVWADRAGIDVAPTLWAAGREQALLGQPAVVPAGAALLVDVASHATSHLMRGSGALLHWLDVAALAAEAEAVDDVFPNWVYPSLALASRAFPNEHLAAHAARLAPSVGLGLARLVERVPLDDRAGLNLRGVNVARFGRWKIVWRYLRPNPWKVRLAYPNLPDRLALPAYLVGVGAHAVLRATSTPGRDDR